MSQLTPEIALEVLAACQAGAEEAASALSRSLDGEFSLSVGDPTTFAEKKPEELDGPGLAIVLQFAGEGLAVLMPQSSGLLPDWVAAPDATGESKLSTLAQELSMLLVPERLMADAFEAAHVSNLQEALRRGSLDEGAALVPLQLQAADQTAELSVIWPLASPGKILVSGEDSAESTPPEQVSSANATRANLTETVDFTQLPNYSRSLLKVSVPAHVQLANKKESVNNIVELAPGTIIKFDKSCEELLRLYVENRPVAEGEAVKVGDKFGFRVSSILMPEEHFLPAQKRSAS